MNKIMLNAVQVVCILLALITTVKADASELYLPQSLLESEMDILAAQLANHKVDENDDNGAFVLQLMDQKFEKAKVNIPVLSINGYYDDGHISSLDYLKKHMKYNKNAEHYWVIGPYNHFFSRSDWINGYQKDPIAALDRSKLAFEWFDYVLKGAKKPDLVKDKVNYQLMGNNSWQHASSM